MAGPKDNSKSKTRTQFSFMPNDPLNLDYKTPSVPTVFPNIPLVLKPEVRQEKELELWEKQINKARREELEALKKAEIAKRTFKITDARKVRATTGQPMRPESDFLTGYYDPEIMKEVIGYAKNYNVDPYTALAIGLGETKFGQSDSNIGHVTFSTGTSNPSEKLVRGLIEKNKYAENFYKKRNLGKPSEEAVLQAYQGYGIITPRTEKDYHGFEMDKIFGVSIPKEGLNMLKTNLKGKDVIDIRENVLKKDPKIVKLVNETERIPLVFPGLLQRHELDEEPAPSLLPGPKMKKHGGWVYPANTAYPAYSMGGRLTEEGKEARKRAPRTYNYPDPSNVTSGPMDQRGNSNLVFGAGGWTGYPDHTMYSSGMERFDRVRDYTKYADGGPVTWSVVENRPMAQEGFRVQGSSPLDVPQGFFLNPGQSRIQPKIYYPSYTPGQNAAKGTAEQDYTLEELFMPMPAIGKALGKVAKAETTAATKGLSRKAAGITQDKLENYVFEGNKYNIWEDLGKADKTIQTEGKKILKDLSSEEGIKRLKGQFRKANPDLNEDQIHYLTGVRLNEVMESIRNNQNKFFRTNPEWVDEPAKFDLLFPLNNAHFNSKWNPFNIQSVQAPNRLFPKSATTEVSKFKLAKNSPYEDFTNPDFEPGSISLGKNLEENVRILDHEIGHAIQKKGYTPIDKALRDLATPNSRRDELFHKSVVESNPELFHDYEYFMKGSGRSEPYAFLREQRRKMLERGILKEKYDLVDFNKLKEARLKAASNTGKNFIEGDRLIKFIPPWKYNRLAEIMNEAPAVIPGLAGTSAAGYIASQKSQPQIQKQGGKVTWQIIK